MTYNLKLGRCLRVIGILVWMKDFRKFFVTPPDFFVGGSGGGEVKDGIVIRREVLCGEHCLSLVGRVANKNEETAG